MIPGKGHGSILLHENEDGSVQLRDNLSRLWCACGRPAVHYFNGALPQYQFKCIKCALDEDGGAEMRSYCYIIGAHSQRKAESIAVSNGLLRHQWIRAHGGMPSHLLDGIRVESREQLLGEFTKEELWLLTAHLESTNQLIYKK
ncbi:hypothetical protein [Paenibacillus sp. 32352]|uniref:hypothetical protein n=1 Tax=Paenibacillus sp. 32352 TaxID=1969111 RepID=UPI0009ADC548|nr:hypothetical protein [Paenibacillus sp. 32352]